MKNKYCKHLVHPPLSCRKCKYGDIEGGFCALDHPDIGERYDLTNSESD